MQTGKQDVSNHMDAHRLQHAHENSYQNNNDRYGFHEIDSAMDVHKLQYGFHQLDILCRKLTALFLVEDLLEELMLLQEALLDKSIEFNDVIKLGRTHLQDAVPIRMGQEFHAFATAIVRDIRRIKVAFSNLKSVNMGATAVGTGINTDERYKRICVKHLCDITQIELTSARDLIDGTRNVDPFVFAHASLKTLCVSLSKMCNDLRLMASGPKTGLAEIVLPRHLYTKG